MKTKYIYLKYTSNLRSTTKNCFDFCSFVPTRQLIVNELKVQINFGHLVAILIQKLFIVHKKCSLNISCISLLGKYLYISR